MSQLTIDEIKKMKLELERNILNQCKDFERKTGLGIEGCGFECSDGKFVGLTSNTVFKLQCKI